MLEFYQQQRLCDDTFVRHPSLPNWLTFAECGPFQGESRKALMSCPLIHHIITRRKTPRIPYDNEVFVSAAGELYRGISWSLSAGGLGFVTDQSTLIETGQRLNILINANYDHGAFQVKGRVVNLKKETNYERVAIEFDQSNDFIDQFIANRVPC
jgi:hypothetical protein